MHLDSQAMRGFAKGVGKSWNYGVHYRRTRFGSIAAILYWSWFLDTDLVQEMHWNINRWTEKEANVWKTSCVSSLNSVSVAAAIFASVGLSALELPELETCHWSTRAFLVSSMALGVLAVIAATQIHKDVMQCYTSAEIRLFLARGVTRHRYKPPYDSSPLESSAATIKLLEAPTTLLYAATAMYLIAMGFYYLFQFSSTTSTPERDNRNIFIFFVSIVGFALLYLASLNAVRRADSGQKKLRLKTDNLYLCGIKSSEMATLDQYLKFMQKYRMSHGEDADALQEAHRAACAIMVQKEDAYCFDRFGSYGVKMIGVDDLLPKGNTAAGLGDKADKQPREDTHEGV